MPQPNTAPRQPMPARRTRVYRAASYRRASPASTHWSIPGFETRIGLLGRTFGLEDSGLVEDVMDYVTESNITGIVLDRWSAVPEPRLRRIMHSMIRHLHAFVRDIEPTEQEWMAAIEWLTRTGKLSNDKRQEFILASDVIGVSMLVDCINHRLSSEATPTTVTGPFHIHGSPNLPDGADIAKGAPGELCYVVGSVRSAS